MDLKQISWIFKDGKNRAKLLKISQIIFHASLIMLLLFSFLTIAIILNRIVELEKKQYHEKIAIEIVINNFFIRLLIFLLVFLALFSITSYVVGLISSFMVLANAKKIKVEYSQYWNSTGQILIIIGLFFPLILPLIGANKIIKNFKKIENLLGSSNENSLKQDTNN